VGSCRVASSLSVLDFFSLGSSLSVRCNVRLGSELAIHGNVRVPSSLQFLNSDTYMKETSNGLFFYVSGSKAMTVESDGGILHGSWNVESSLVTSDRRLKTDIMPLQRTLRDVISGDTKQQEVKAPRAGPAGTSSDGALWLLRQLRPVSYSFRKGADSKNMRFGFIADELESVVPQVVRSVGQKDVVDQKAVLYQDLIALLAAAAQSQQHAIESQQHAIEEQRSAIEELRAEVLLLKQDALRR